MSERGPGPDPSELGIDATTQWQQDTAEAIDSPAPAEPEPVADALVQQPEVLQQEQAETLEADPMKALEYAQERAKQELAERYNLNDPNILKRFSGNLRAFFSGEFADLNVSEDLANREKNGELKAEDFSNEIGRSFRLSGAEGLRKLGKIAAKTGVSGGIGACVVAALGGTIASPVFLGALAGGAIARGGFELYRHLNHKERDARAGVIESRTEVFREAIKFQDEAQTLNAELAVEITPPERREEINNRLSEITKYLVDLTAFESYKADEKNVPEAEQQKNSGLALTRELATGKMSFEKKRETISDLVSAGGSILGGMAGQAIQHTLLRSVESAHGFMADFDKDGVQHFVEKVSDSNLQGASSEFIKHLHESGNYVFHYNGLQEASRMAHLAAEHHQVLTQAVLKDGSVVHILPGMNDSLFSSLLPHTIRETAIAAKDSIVKEALPVAASQLIYLLKYFSGRSRGAEVAQPVAEGEVSGRVPSVAPEQIILPDSSPVANTGEVSGRVPSVRPEQIVQDATSTGDTAPVAEAAPQPANGFRYERTEPGHLVTADTLTQIGTEMPINKETGADIRLAIQELVNRYRSANPEQQDKMPFEVIESSESGDTAKIRSKQTGEILSLDVPDNVNFSNNEGVSIEHTNLDGKKTHSAPFRVEEIAARFFVGNGEQASAPATGDKTIEFPAATVDPVEQTDLPLAA